MQGRKMAFGEIVVKKIKVKIASVGGSKHTIYLKKAFVTDSAFPFQPGQDLEAKIVGNKVVIEKPREDLPPENKKGDKIHG